MGTDLLPFDEVAALIAAASFVGVLLLAPLYLSQRRDVRRLRAWMERHPDYAAGDLARSEARLDSTEVELERVYAERGEPVPGTGERPEATEVYSAGMAPAARVTSERPALERVTLEREALRPHPRWRRFVAWATQPRWLAALAAVALLTAGAAIVGVQILLDDDDANRSGGSELSGIEVAVLNTTSAGGIAGRVSRQIENEGFLPGAVDTFERDSDQSVVMYQPGRKRFAKRIARELDGVAVQAIDRNVEEVAPSADVVVILGEDRVAG